MTFRFRTKIRHPFFPGSSPTPVNEARGRASALSGSYADLEQAFAQGVSAERAVFVLLERTAPVFTSAQRDRLWELYQTPVYAILIGGDGRVEGFECEVQCGFHAPGKPPANAEMVCECGRLGPLMEVDAGKTRLAGV
jgi:hypothetical protein